MLRALIVSGVCEIAKIDTKDLPVQQPETERHQVRTPARPPLSTTAKKRARIIKKVRIAGGLWKFISLDRVGNRYVWDKRPGYYFLEWWEGKKRRCQRAGETPSEAIEAQRRKRNELLGELLAEGKTHPKLEEGTATAIADAIPVFLEHVKVHSPDKPLTVRRYRQVLGHFERLLGKKKYVEAITRADHRPRQIDGMVVPYGPGLHRRRLEPQPPPCQHTQAAVGLLFRR